ncbi:hypothetical protein G5C51_12240 [Streptomyces sp. A7024]|uniref:Lipoprotein n=1 Tax=Streptomyces coryli TaxID=1128680 RepID=A0A6G4U054_9ACTN|nr:glycoside hydrolase [Streptomyces coryli]NGN64667.1 hypothetical protein [Streptomyces coryli]
MPWNLTKRRAALLTAGACVAGALVPTVATGSPEEDQDGIRVRVTGGTATVDPGTLAVTARTRSGQDLTLSGASATGLGTPTDPETVPGGARWRYPDRGLTVTAAARHGRLEMSVRAAKDGTLDWPRTGAGADALQLPKGSGLSVPAGDTWWNTESDLVKAEPMDMTAGLTLPLWGYTSGKAGVSYLVPDPIGTTLDVGSSGGRLRTAASHEFSKAADTRTYTVTFKLTDASPVAAAADYRSWMREHGDLTSLREKIAANPDTERLLGAFHAYGWGQARTANGVAKLRKLGIDRMWLGYDADDTPMTKAAVRAAQRAGYLVGPYDSYANAQAPESADAPTSVWPDPVYQDACVRRADGSVKPGFGGRGCYLSSQAFTGAKGQRLLDEHTAKFTGNGARSYFLDVDAAGELFADHSATHPMNQRQDRANRLERMHRLGSPGRRLVLGSESAGAWASGPLAYSHGNATPVADGLWALQNDKKAWGGYAPHNAPAFFFKPVELPAELAKEMYDPRYRVPLYETALHDVLVGAERWELSYEKLPAQKTDRALLAMLYNIPLNFVLDGPAIDQHGKELAALQRYFAPLHKAVGTEPMTAFDRLTEDRTVQRTTFGDGKLTVTANFGDQRRAGVDGGCVRAELRGDEAARTLCPGELGQSVSRG